MGTGRTLRKESHVRPCKTPAGKARKSAAQRRRLVKFGLGEDEVKIMSDENQSFLDAHFGVVHGSPERLQIGASIWLHTAADYDNTAAILLALAVLGRDQRTTKLKSLRELVDLISQAPDAKCEAIVDFAKYIAKSQED